MTLDIQWTEILKSIYNFLKINDSIYTSGQPTEDEFEKISKSGIDTVINLGLSNQSYSLPNEDHVVKSLNMNYFHIPVSFENPTSKNYETFSKIMGNNNCRKILIHCAANKRVSIFVGIFLVKEHSWTNDEAQHLINKVWTPNSCWKKFYERELLQTSAEN